MTDERPASLYIKMPCGHEQRYLYGSVPSYCVLCRLRDTQQTVTHLRAVLQSIADTIDTTLKRDLPVSAKIVVLRGKLKQMAERARLALADKPDFAAGSGEYFTPKNIRKFIEDEEATK